MPGDQRPAKTRPSRSVVVGRVAEWAHAAERHLLLSGGSHDLKPQEAHEWVMTRPGVHSIPVKFFVVGLEEERVLIEAMSSCVVVLLVTS